MKIKINVLNCLIIFVTSRSRLYYRDIKDENVNLINVNVDVITTFQTFCFVTFKIDLLLEFEVVERGEPVKVWNTKEMI